MLQGSKFVLMVAALVVQIVTGGFSPVATLLWVALILDSFDHVRAKK